MRTDPLEENEVLNLLKCSVKTTEDADLLMDLLSPFALSASWEINEEHKTVEILFEEGYKEQLKKMMNHIKDSSLIQFYTYTVEPLENRDWLQENYQQFQPFSVGTFYVYGSHIASPNPQQLIPLEVDAATAFGSGSHGSTSGCLEALSYCHEQGYTFKNALDMGCGSGILAMAVNKLWPIHVVACDIDPESIIVTEKNININHTDKVMPICGDGFNTPLVQKHAPYDLIVANILAQPLRDMAQDLAAVAHEGSNVILSGFTTDQVKDLESDYHSQHFKTMKLIQKGEWCTLILSY